MPPELSLEKRSPEELSPGDASLGDLLQALESPRAEERARAARGLGDLQSPEAADALGRALGDADPAVRRQAGFALGKIQDSRAVDALIEAAIDTREDTRRAAFAALRHTGWQDDARTVPVLIQALQDPDPGARDEAANTLGANGQFGKKRLFRKANRALAPLLDDPHLPVRQSAAYALALIGGFSAHGPLLRGLEDEDAYVRELAAAGLAAMKEGRALEPLLEIVRSGHSHGWACEALARLGDRLAIEPLRFALLNGDDELRRDAATALRSLGIDPES